MTLAITHRAAVLAPPLPRSPGRARVAAAVAHLQTALDQLYAEEHEKEAARERARAANDAEIKRRVLRAQARDATRGTRVEVPAKWFWDFANGALDSMRDLAREARKQGQNGPANALEVRIDAAVKTLDEIQKRAAR